MSDQIKHQTFVFERRCPASIDRVFGALSDAQERARWSAPSETAAFVYDATDFLEGGQDVFRCGDKSDPQFTGQTTYLVIERPGRIVSSEVITSGGEKLMASLITAVLEPHGDETDLRIKVQTVSFQGEAMLKGVEAGNNAALDNLVEHLRSAR